MQGSMSDFHLNTISEAIEDIRMGKIVIVVDDEDRENEGDFICAAECTTPEVVNFMCTQGRGLICVALDESICKKLNLDLMVPNATDPLKTAFTVSVDLLGEGCTTGISAHDRSKTIQALTDDNREPHHFSRPGHIFPLIAKPGGVLRRTGHTEAAVDLARLAGLKPAGTIVEIMNDDGTMARLPQLISIAQKHALKIVSIRDLISFRLQTDVLLQKVEETLVDSIHGTFERITFTAKYGGNTYHAFCMKGWSADDIVPVRMHSANHVEDVFSFDKQNVLSRSLEIIRGRGFGVLVYIVPEARSHVNDPLDFGLGAQVLRELGIHRMQLITSAPLSRRRGLEGYGLEICSTLHPLEK